MNILENYIKKIYSEEDVTEEFNKKISQRRDPNEKIFLVDMEIDCYGQKERVKRYFYEDDLKEAKEKGYYMA